MINSTNKIAHSTEFVIRNLIFILMYQIKRIDNIVVINKISK